LANGAAEARDYRATVSGVIISQNLPGNDPLLKVGDKISLVATFNDASFVKWGDFGYSIADVYDRGTVSIDLNGINYSSLDDGLDGQVEFFDYYRDGTSYSLVAPAIAFSGKKIIGVSGDLLPVSTTSKPRLTLGYFAAHGYYEEIDGVVSSGFSPTSFTSYFNVSGGNYDYGNSTASLGFVGQWDFAHSLVVAVPEPAIWSLMILGFGLVGGVTRRGHRDRSAGLFQAASAAA